MSKTSTSEEIVPNQPFSMTILVVDDDELIREMLVKLLNEKGYTTISADRGQVALNLIRQKTYDLAMIDYELPDMNGIDLLRKMREVRPSLLCLIITGYGTIERAVEAMQTGAWDFVTKPITFNMLLEKIERIQEYCQLRREHDFRNRATSHDFRFSGVIGHSSAMQAVYESILRAAQSSLPVLIEGETGSGKEFIAESIHLNSPRQDKPYIVMDCTATPESLIESTLFGSTKGAFTGSVERKGLLQSADGGTLFLDEVGEIALDIQPKLLRCLETKRFRPVGSTKECSSDFRIICATNRDLLNQTRKGEFRSDLFYRISAQRIYTPPLRERSTDIPILANHFLAQVSLENPRGEVDFSEDALRALSNYNWPGNIRQMKFVIEAAYFHTRDNQIDESDLNLDGDERIESDDVLPPRRLNLDQDFKTFRESAILEAERDYLTALLEKNNGDVRAAALQAGLTREALYRVMSRCGLSPGQFRLKE